MENDRRSSPRVICHGTAEVQVGNEAPTSVHILDLSADGCHLLLDTPQDIARDAEVVLTFEVDEVAYRVVAQAKSIRSDASFGFHFPDLPEDVRIQLQNHVGLLGQVGRPVVNRLPWEPTPTTH